MSIDDRIVWGVLLFIGINFLWMGLLSDYVTQWLGASVGLAACFGLIFYGPRPKEDEHVEKGE